MTLLLSHDREGSQVHRSTTCEYTWTEEDSRKTVLFYLFGIATHLALLSWWRRGISLFLFRQLADKFDEIFQTKYETFIRTGVKRSWMAGIRGSSMSKVNDPQIYRRIDRIRVSVVNDEQRRGKKSETILFTDDGKKSSQLIQQRCKDVSS